MDDVSFAELATRSAIALTVVLLVLIGAYLVARRRGSVSGPARAVRPARPGTARSTRTRPGRARRRGASQGAVRVEGRVGVARGAAIVTVRFGDRVLLVGAPEQGALSVLAEMDGNAWDELHAVADDLVPVPVPAGGASDEIVVRPGFLDALREATARRA